MTNWLLRHLLRRRTLVAFGVGVAIFVSLYLALRISLAYEARRASGLCAALNDIKVGDSQESLGRVLRSYGGYQWVRANAEQDNLRHYILEVNPWYFGDMTGRHRRFEKSATAVINLLNIKPSLRRSVGLRQWVVRGAVDVDHGIVSSVGGSVIVEGSDEWLGADWNLGREMPSYIRQDVENPWPELNRYFVRWTHLKVLGSNDWITGEGVETWVTPAASDSELLAARHVNVSCLTSRRGCPALCDLMPDAAQYHKAHPEAGWWGNAKTRCR